MFALHLYHTTSKSYTLLFFYYMYYTIHSSKHSTDKLIKQNLLSVSMS